MGFFDFDSGTRAPHTSFAQFAEDGGNFDLALNLTANCLDKTFEQRQLYSAILSNVCA